MQPWVLFTIPSLHSPSIFFFFSVGVLSCLLVQEHTRPGVVVFVQTSADFCFASGGVRSQARERQREKEADRAREQSHPPKTVNCMKEYECFFLSGVLEWMSAPSLFRSAVSVRLFVDFGCRGEVPVMPHHMTLVNIDCSFQVSSWVTLSLPASFSWLGTEAVPANSTVI